MVLKYHISPSAIAEDFIVKIWEAGSDGIGAEVYTSPNIPTPHIAPYTLTVNGLDKVVHIVRMYTALSAVLLHEFNAEPKTDIVTTYAPIRFKIGDGKPLTPAAGTTDYINPLLAGLTADDYTIMRNNVGLIFPGTDPGQFQADGGNNKFILNSPDQFGDLEEWTVQIKPNVITSVVNDSVVGKYFAGFVDVNSNRNYLNSDLRKLIRLNGTSEYTFPVGQVIPIGYGFLFQKFGSSLGTAKVKFLNGTLLWGTTPKSELEIPDYSELMVSWDGTNWNVVFVTPAAPVAGPISPGTILGQGILNIGDLPGGDPTYTITHGLNITGDYIVYVSIRGTAASISRDNDVLVVWYHHATDKPNKFIICAQERLSGTQNLSFCWIIIKM